MANRNRRSRGTITLQFLVIMVPVVLGMMGFAVDLGRLYLVRGELNQAASAMAIAAALKLNGTTAATDAATAAAQATLDDTMNDANKYNFGSLVVGQGNALLTSTVQQPAYFQNLTDAVASLGQTGAGSGADGTTARHVAINLTADSPLLFWSLLSLGQSRKTSIAAAAVAGVSAPVCVACGIEPFAVAAANSSDMVDFGFVPGTIYTLGSMCTGAATVFANTTRANYLLINRNDVGSAFTEVQQLFRIGAQGLITSTATPGWACSTIGGTESLWTGTQLATPLACAATTPNTAILDAMCGLSTRLTNVTPTACSNTDFSAVLNAYAQDTDVNFYVAGDYADYAGNNRRLITVPVVDALSTTATMNVLGFRQFLIEPNADGSLPNFADGDGRFAAMFLDTPQLSGAVAPVKQGSIAVNQNGTNISCGISSGPGKVVLHQ